MLSICIATYNRAACLAELLESICLQDVDNIEVVIGDDASLDNTKEVVKSYKSRLPGLQYLNNEINLGPDRNFLSVVEAASSKFVWIVGDDDRLIPGALKAVLWQLEQWPDICGLTPGVIDYDRSMMQPIGIKPMPDTTRLQGIKEVFATMIELLGCISATIVNRRMWLQVCQSSPINDFMNYYLHVYIIGCMIGPLGFWGVLNLPCIIYRTDNDQTLTSIGWFKRLELDVVSYDQIFRGVQPGQQDFLKMMNRRILQRHIMSRIYNAKANNVSCQELSDVFLLLAKFYNYISYLWLCTFPVMMTPSWILRVLRSLYQTYSPKSGARQARRFLNNRS